MQGAVGYCLAILFTFVTMFFAFITNLSAILTKVLENDTKTVKKQPLTSGIQYLFFAFPANYL